MQGFPHFPFLNSLLFSPFLSFPIPIFPSPHLIPYASVLYNIRYIRATMFGALLDVITDCCATLVLTFCLCIFYPSWLILWQLVTALDFSSHWYNTVTTYLLGGKSHKEGHTNPLLNFFYWNVSIVVEYAP